MKIRHAAAVVLLGGLAACGTSHARPKPPPTVITEDDLRWNCHTMGNRICGPPPAEWPQGDILAAQAYAVWCQGTVEDPLGREGGPYVVGCQVGELAG